MIPGMEGNDAFLSRLEKQREALAVLFPHPKEMKERSRLITTVSGFAPNMYDLYCAFAEWEVWDAMENNREINWNKLDPIQFLTEYSMAIRGKHSDRAVEIARAAPESQANAFWARIFGKE